MDLEFPTIEVPATPAPAAAPAPAPKPADQTALAVVTVKDAVLARFAQTEHDMRALADKWRDVAFDCKTPKGLAEAKKARLELRESGRYAVARAVSAVKTEVNDLKRVMDGEAERLIAIVQPVEDSIDKQIKAREEEIERERAERERLAAERRAKFEAEIAKIRAYVGRAQGLPSSRIALGIAQLEAMTFPVETWAEFAVPAADAQCQTLEQLRQMHADTKVREDAAAQVEAQRQENARIAAEQAQRQRELDAQAAALRAEQERIAAQRDAEEQEARRRDEADARAKAEQDSRSQVSGAQPGGDTGTMAHQSDDAAPVAGPAEGAGAAAPAPGTTTATADAAHQDVPPAGAAEKTITLGAIGERLGFSLTASFVTVKLGIQSAGRAKAAVLFRESDWPLICDALVKHIEALP